MRQTIADSDNGGVLFFEYASDTRHIKLTMYDKATTTTCQGHANCRNNNNIYFKEFIIESIDGVLHVEGRGVSFIRNYVNDNVPPNSFKYNKNDKNAVKEHSKYMTDGVEERDVYFWPLNRKYIYTEVVNTKILRFVEAVDVNIYTSNFTFIDRRTHKESTDEI